MDTVYKHEPPELTNGCEAVKEGLRKIGEASKKTAVVLKEHEEQARATEPEI